MGPIIAAGTAVAIDTAREPEPERRPPAEPEPEPGPGLEPDARCVDDAGSEDRANTAVDPWEIGPLPSASNPVGNDIPADAPASEPQHVGGAVEPADLADTIDLTPVGEQDAAMPVREWRRIATTAGGILLAACVTVAGMSAWESHESATAARERRRKPNRSWLNISTATGSHRRKRSRPTSSPTRKPWKPSTTCPNDTPQANGSPHAQAARKRRRPPRARCDPRRSGTPNGSHG